MTRGRGVTEADDPGAADVEAFLAALPADQRTDAETLIGLMGEATRSPARLWLVHRLPIDTQVPTGAVWAGAPVGAGFHGTHERS